MSSIPVRRQTCSVSVLPASSVRPAGSTCRGTSSAGPATCKPACKAGRAATAACSLPSTTSGHAHDAGHLGCARPCDTVPSRDLSGWAPDSGARWPPGLRGRVLRRAHCLSSAWSSPLLRPCAWPGRPGVVVAAAPAAGCSRS